MGFTWEMDCHLFYRRAQQLGLVAGARQGLERAAGQPARTPQRGLRPDKGTVMDFNDTPEEAAYRAKARAWLEANAPKRARRRRELATRAPTTWPRAKAWQAKKAAAGYACITWPKEWGGGGGTPIQR